MFGAGGGTSSYKEVEETDLLILWGSNARETHPIFFHHVLKAVHRGARLYVVDPRRTSSAQWADTWLGLDVAAAGLARARDADATRSFGMFSCSKASNEVNFLAQKFVRSVMGSNNIDSCNRT